MTLNDIISAALGVGALFGGIGYAVGQFLSSRRRGVADSLATALDEVKAISLRADRFEDELHRQAQDMAELRAENVTLRSLLTGGEPILRALEKAKAEVEAFATAEHDKTRALIERITKEVR